MTSSEFGYSIITRIFDNSDIVFVITPEGEELLPVKVLADYFEVPLHRANETITKKRDLYVDKVVKLQTGAIEESDRIMGSDYRMKTIDCFTLSGALQYVNGLSHLRYSGERKDTIVNMKNWLVDLGASVIQGKPLGQVDRDNVRIISSELTLRIRVLLKEKIVDKYEDGRNHDHIYGNEFRMLNKATIGEHQRGMKETLNAAGLQVHNTGQVADLALLNADVLDYHKRKSAVTNTIGMVYGVIDTAKLKLTEQEQARLSRRCSKTQTGISDFMAVV